MNLNLPNLVGVERHGGRPYHRWSDGTLLPVARGGDGSGDGGAGDAGGSGSTGSTDGGGGQGAGGGDERRFTQEDLNRRLTAEKEQGRRAAEADLLKRLGVTDAAEAERILKEHRDAEAAKLTETDRAKQEAAAAAAQAKADRDAAAAERRAAAVERALVRAGLQLPEDEGEAAEALTSAVRLVDLDGEPTPDAVKAAVDKVKGRFGALFAAPAEGPGTGTGGRINGGDPQGRGRQQQGGKTGIAAGRERARQEAEERSKRGNPLDRMNFVGGRR